MAPPAERAARAGATSAAAIGPTIVEPLPPGHPLLELSNALLTPHLGYVTEGTYRIFYAHALEDVQAYLAGRPLRVLSP